MWWRNLTLNFYIILIFMNLWPCGSNDQSLRQNHDSWLMNISKIILFLRFPRKTRFACPTLSWWHCHLGLHLLGPGLTIINVWFTNFWIEYNTTVRLKFCIQTELNLALILTIVKRYFIAWSQDAWTPDFNYQLEPLIIFETLIFTQNYENKVVKKWPEMNSEVDVDQFDTLWISNVIPKRASTTI